MTSLNLTDFILNQSKAVSKHCILSPQEKITYPKLWRQTARLATWICRQFGTGKEIILLADNSPFFITSYLAVIKSGNKAVLIPTDISAPDLKKLTKKYKFSICFLQRKFLDKSLPNITTITEKDIISLPQAQQEFAPTKADDTAVIIFTSGSTGGKKGVMLTHRNLAANASSIIKFQHLTHHDRIEVVLPFFYSFGLSLLNTHLRVGGSLILHQSPFLGSVIEDIKHYHCTGLAGVSATYQILIQKTNFLTQSLPSLRYMSHSGGKLADSFIKELMQAFPQKKIFMMFGVTEASPRLAYLPPHLLKTKLGSIGKGIPSVTIQVVDSRHQVVKPGKLGEIRARGPNIMKGYYQDPQATQKVLKNGWLYTGDIATIDRDGFIYVKGRKTNIIKAAGHRISSEEVAEIISHILGVTNLCVFGAPDNLWGESVAAVVETNRSIENLKNKILTICKQQLPSYKVPRYLVFTKHLPLNSSSKLAIPQIKKRIIFLIQTGKLPEMVEF